MSGTFLDGARGRCCRPPVLRRRAAPAATSWRCRFRPTRLRGRPSFPACTARASRTGRTRASKPGPASSGSGPPVTCDSGWMMRVVASPRVTTVMIASVILSEPTVCERSRPPRAPRPGAAGARRVSGGTRSVRPGTRRPRVPWSEGEVGNGSGAADAGDASGLLAGAARGARKRGCPWRGTTSWTRRARGGSRIRDHRSRRRRPSPRMRSAPRRRGPVPSGNVCTDRPWAWTLRRARGFRPLQRRPPKTVGSGDGPRYGPALVCRIVSVLVVTGTCTGVGKTVVTAALAAVAAARGASVAVVKPGQTGVDGAEPVTSTRCAASPGSATCTSSPASPTRCPRPPPPAAPGSRPSGRRTPPDAFGTWRTGTGSSSSRARAGSSFATTTRAPRSRTWRACSAPPPSS